MYILAFDLTYRLQAHVKLNTSRESSDNSSQAPCSRSSWYEERTTFSFLFVLLDTPFPAKRVLSELGVAVLGFYRSWRLLARRPAP